MMIARWFAAYDRLVTLAARGQALPMYAAVSGALDTVDRTFLENRAVTVLNNGSAKVGPTY